MSLRTFTSTGVTLNLVDFFNGNQVFELKVIIDHENFFNAVFAQELTRFESLAAD